MITARELSWLGMIAAQLPALSPNSMELLSGGERRNMGDDDDDVRVFTKLYNDGLQHHRRREEISTPQVSQLSSHPANPETFERLHRDHEALLKKREDMTEVFFRRMIPQSNGKSDPERLKNLQQPRLAKAHLHLTYHLLTDHGKNHWDYQIALSPSMRIMKRDQNGKIKFVWKLR